MMSIEPYRTYAPIGINTTYSMSPPISGRYLEPRHEPITVYRLENHIGRGPFSGNRRMAELLISHNDPLVMLDSMGLDRDWLGALVDAGAVFGWNSKELMMQFFEIESLAIRTAPEMKMKISAYVVDRFLEFPDGQVLFLKSTAPISRVSLKQFFYRY